MTTQTLTGACTECGEPVTREKATSGGRFAEQVNALPFVCVPCQDRIAEQDAQADDARAEEGLRRHAQRNRSQSGIPTALRDLGWAELDDAAERTDAIVKAREWANGYRDGLVLSGPIGVGKTRIAATAANAALDRRAVNWMSAALLFARLGSGFGSPARDQAIGALLSKTALVLDDIDKTRPTEYAAEQVFLAIDQRVENKTPLLVTMNLTLGEIAAKFPEPFGEAIASRLAGYCEYVRVNGDDRRTLRSVGETAA